LCGEQGVDSHSSPRVVTICPTRSSPEFYAAAVGLLTWWIDHDVSRVPTRRWRAAFDN